jgi:hypothetical protein
LFKYQLYYYKEDLLYTLKYYSPKFKNFNIIDFEFKELKLNTLLVYILTRNELIN